MTTADNAQRMTEIRALRMLRSGDSVKDVSQATGLSHDEILKLHRDFPSTAPAPVMGTATPAVERTRPALTEAITHASPAPVTLVTPAPSALTLLDEALEHGNPAIRRLAAQVQTKLERLQQLITEHAAAEKARKKAEQEKAAALAEVVRLEAALEAARAKAGITRKTTKTKAKQASGWTEERRQQARERMLANRERLEAAKAAKREQQ